MEKKVTKRDNFLKIVEILTETGNEELAKVINHEVELLDKKAMKAKETAAKKNAVNDALTGAVKTVLTNEFAVISEITEKVAEIVEDNVTDSKVRYRLNALVENGFAAKAQVSVGEGDTKRKLMGYKLTDVVEADAE